MDGLVMIMAFSGAAYFIFFSPNSPKLGLINGVVAWFIASLVFYMVAYAIAGNIANVIVQMLETLFTPVGMVLLVISLIGAGAAGYYWNRIRSGNDTFKPF